MKWEKATVFISSTFNDMHAERDYLIKEVFPELTEWCEERKIRLTDIDLRWGVTEEDSNNSKTIETCLRHIDKSRPFFLCFLGQRRGWIPNFKEDINDETKRRYTSIDDLDGRSATEMEIEHALLKPIHIFLNEKEYDCPSAKHSLFFFRDDSYLNDITDYQKLIYTNDSEGSADEIKLADDELEKTKDKIRNRKKLEDAKSDGDKNKVNVLISDYEGFWDKELILHELDPFVDKDGNPHYDHNENQGRLTDFKSGGKPLKEVIIEQLKGELAIAFPDHMHPEKQTELQKDLDQQEIFCYLNSEGFIERPEYTGELTEYVEDSTNKKVCLVSADAGYGKTMLLAKFATDFEDKYPNKRLFKRFCGVSDLSSKTYSLWKSIIDEAEIDPQEKFYPNNVDELKRNISEILNAIAQKGDCVIIIDAINQMPNGINMLKWFDELPDNLKLIISIKEDRTDEKFNSQLEKIKQRNNICGFEIEKLDDDSKKSLIEEYLKNYLKQLDSEQINTICGFEGSKNPLYLKILLAELRVFGSFDQLKDEIKQFGDSPLSAFEHVLERLEKDEKQVKGENIVPLLFSLLANSRNGLSEEEIISIIKDNISPVLDHDGEDITEKYVTDNVRLNLRQVRPFMARKEGRHDFFYEKFKESSIERYKNDKIRINGLLADYFMTKADLNGDFSFVSQGEDDNEKSRPLNELPYHLNEAERYVDLSKVLSSFAFIKNKLGLSNINNVIADYQFRQGHEFLDSDDHPIVLIGRALELSAPILEDNEDQLATQLWGRMNGIGDGNETIGNLLSELDSSTSDKWLKSKSNALYSPKSAIIKRIKPDGKKSTTAIAMVDDNTIIIGTEDGKLNIFDMDENDIETLNESESKIIKIILNDDGTIVVANADGSINEWDINNKAVTKEYPKIDAEITDIYISKTYQKIYVSSHDGVYSIDLKTNELKREDIESKNYNQILVPRRNEAILVCDEKEVDGWDVYEMRKAYNKQHQQNDEEDSGTKIDSSEEIRFMGLNKRFLTLISENGQMKFWNTLKNSGGGESIAEIRVCSPNDKFTQAKTLEDENEIITISDMGVMRVWDIPQPRSPQFDAAIDIQSGIKSPTAIDYHTNGEDREVIVGNVNNDVSIIDLKKEVEEDTAVRHLESVLSIKVDGNRMITASDNGEIFTWDFDSEQFVNSYSNDFRCNSISYNRANSQLVLAGVKAEKDGRKTYTIATCTVGDDMWEAKSGEDNNLEVEETINSEEIIDIAQNESGIVFLEKNKLSVNGSETKFDKAATTLATKFDSNDVFVGFEDGSIVKDGGATFDDGIKSPVTKIKILGDKVIAGFENGLIEILDLDLSNHESLNAHEKGITNLYVDDAQLISLSKDNTIKFWDMNTQQCRYTYYLDIFATSVDLKDGKLVVGDTLGNVRFFEFNN